MLIFGLNPVLEALRAGRVRVVRVSARADERMRAVIDAARGAGVRVEHVDPATLDREARGGVHQGVVAEARDPDPCSIEDLVYSARTAPLIVVLDGVEDPHNVGAILRTVDAAGAHGLVRQARHAASLDGIAAKASAGAVAHVKIATEVNIARAVEALKELGVWTVGLAGDAPEGYEAVDFTVPTAVVLGAEGSGLRRLVRDRCDRLVSIPMHGSVESLNVSVAAGIVLFEAIRQRREKVKGKR